MTLHARDYARDDVGRGCIAIDLDGVVQGMSPPIRSTLIARGLLACRDGVWYLEAHGVEQLARDLHLAVCDFCSRRPANWTAACDSFMLDALRKSQGDWAACAVCAAMIRADDRDGLLMRARDAFPITATTLRRIHQRFWRHYRGTVSQEE